MGNVYTLVERLAELIWINSQASRPRFRSAKPEVRVWSQLSAAGSALTISAAVRFALTSVVTLTSTPGSCCGKRVLQPRRIGVASLPFDPGQLRGTGADHQHGEVLRGQCAGDLRQPEARFERDVLRRGIRPDARPMPDRCPASATPAEASVPSYVAPRITRLSGGRARSPALSFGLSIPRNQRRNRHHNGDAENADDHLREDAIGHLRKYEVSGKGQKDADDRMFQANADRTRSPARRSVTSAPASRAARKRPLSRPAPGNA